MDAAILRALLNKVLQYETEYKIQPYLEEAVSHVSSMAGAPQEPSYQTNFAESFKKLKSSLLKMQEALTPGDWDRLAEISSDNDFSVELTNGIEEVISENAATPAVIRDHIMEISQKRASEITRYKNLLGELTYFGFEPTENDVDEGQIGFKIPRDIFHNNLPGLINELNFIRKFVRLVAEAESEEPGKIEVGEISTTDPVFWLIVAYGVAKSVGKVTDWCLDTWKKVEDIRNVRAQTAQLQSFSAEEVDQIFGTKIQGQIDASIQEKVEQLTAEVTDQARKNELQNGLRPTLRQFLARIERGMTVDVRYLPAPTKAGENEEVVEAREERQSEIHVVAAKLVFPRPVGEPVLQIEAANDDNSAPKPSKPKP
ncbi:MAG: hypothetical protein R3E11_10490 [Sphingobium sp.]|nr:hypothetical protein [Sphingobium sp.]MCP5399674.1 hypothetical protein [Sphingomonas sp.]